jgi:hypothetical protein
MCYVSEAIAPLPAWEDAETRATWMEETPDPPPWWAIAWLWPEDDDPLLIGQANCLFGKEKEKEQRPPSPKEGAPRRAPPRERALSTGTSISPAPARASPLTWPDFDPFLTAIFCIRTAGEQRPAQPRAGPVQWFDPSESEPNESELLFFAFLLCFNADSVSGLQEWAKKVAACNTAAVAAG